MKVGVLGSDPLRRVGVGLVAPVPGGTVAILAQAVAWVHSGFTCSLCSTLPYVIMKRRMKRGSSAGDFCP